MNTRNRPELTAILDKLSQYSRMHFEREERIAAAAGYSQVEILNRSHGELMQELDQIKVEMDAVSEEWPEEANARFAGFLHDWLIDHVIREDLLLKPVLQKFSPSYDPR